MIHMNMSAYKQEMDIFAIDLQNNLLTDTTSALSNSSGNAIDRINECSSAFGDYCLNINSLYSSTMQYLNKAYNNINSCEEDN